ncbi:MAG: GNAT family N-acetyltransferase [Xanthomonadaceae bacterium]|nr:GNAT family N-acetyltransferase [Xanthomonadaceae bacterium]
MSESLTKSVSKPINSQIREITDSDLIALGELLDQSFIPKGGSHYFDDFPVWKLRCSSEMKRLGVFDSSGVLLASASCRLAQVRVVGIPERTPIAIIGAVATSEAARGHGFASQLVEALAKWADSRGAWMAVLWASQYEMYHRIGFDLFGEQSRVLVGDLPFVENSLTVPIHHGWNPNLMRHFLIRTEGVVHSASDSEWISKHKNVQWIWSGDPERPSAFLAYNRGIDLPEMIHEWGGQRDAIKPLISTVAKAQPNLQILLHPCHKWILELTPYQLHTEHLGMVKVFSRMKTNPLFAQFSRLSDSEWISTVLGSPENSAFLPIWFWGLDCA